MSTAMIEKGGADHLPLTDQQSDGGALSRRVVEQNRSSSGDGWSRDHRSGRYVEFCGDDFTDLAVSGSRFGDAKRLSKRSDRRAFEWVRYRAA